ncbi:unnamed protein product [Brassica oleracea]
MESKSTYGVFRRKPPSFRFYPYASGSASRKKDMKDEVIRLGVEFSVSVAESMFLLCDDIRTMLFISLALWKYVLPERKGCFSLFITSTQKISNRKMEYYIRTVKESQHNGILSRQRGMISFAVS